MATKARRVGDPFKASFVRTVAADTTRLYAPSRRGWTAEDVAPILGCSPDEVEILFRFGVLKTTGEEFTRDRPWLALTVPVTTSTELRRFLATYGRIWFEALRDGAERVCLEHERKAGHA